MARRISARSRNCHRVMRAILFPFLFDLAFVHFFEIGVRGGSRELEIYLVASVCLSFLFTALIYRWQSEFFDRRHTIVRVALLCAIFFALKGPTTILAEELYIYFTVPGDRRIYGDDSGMGYAIGFNSLPGATLFFAIVGFCFGLIYGFALWLLGVIVKGFSNQRAAGHQ